MKFEETSLTSYLVKNLEPLTEADPVILAKYVTALLKKDKPIKELQKLCNENLVEFLGQDTMPFISKLFQALEDGTILMPAESVNTISQVELSPAVISADPGELRSSSPKPDRVSSSAAHDSDSEEKEISDDEDDDRNHKHRRRETRSQSFEREAHEPFLRRLNKNRGKPFENGPPLLESEPLSGATRKEFTNSERDLSGKRRLGPIPFPRPPLDVCQRARGSQTYFDLSTSLGHSPIGRGRGRGIGSWAPHESRFNPVDALDFASPLVPQVPKPTSLFAGRGLSNAANTTSPSWGAFGLMHGMPAGGLDALHNMHSGLQGAIQPPLNSSLSIGIARPRCRDFEERGFCLRGDMCPMEHGVNRIVVEDVQKSFKCQSLSQFNLPVSISSARFVGMSATASTLPTVTASSTVAMNGKGFLNKSSKYSPSDEGLRLNGVLSSSAHNEADLYDPDQPLWNNDHPETSSGLLKLSSPKVHHTEPPWDSEFSDRPTSRLSDDIDIEKSGRSMAVGAHNSVSSVWGRISHKPDGLSKSDTTSNDRAYHATEANGEPEVHMMDVQRPFHHVKRNFGTVAEDSEHKSTNLMGSSVRRSINGRPLPSHGKGSEKAQRTLFVNCIPQNSNKKEALLSHFKKFGEVIDIYIPPNGERAFIQFSKREDAETALKAPDAVMGNRFIKLWWANWDIVPVEGGSSFAAAPPNIVAASVPSQRLFSEKGKEKITSVVTKISSAPPSDTSSTSAVPLKNFVVKDSKPLPPSQKKLETLEHLKEELRIKQEMLAQKRSDFRKQLDKLEKQGLAVKGETATDHVGKRQKTETVSAVSCTSNPTQVSNHSPGTESVVAKGNSGDSVSAKSLKEHMGPQASPKGSKQPSRLAPSVSSPFLINRYKLDNRPTAFKILPPLPTGLANATVLKEHFAAFGDLSFVDLDEQDDQIDNDASKLAKDCSVHITFTTRHSAERAFLGGKCWQGQNLQFAWIIPSNSASANAKHLSGDCSSSASKAPADTLIAAGSSVPRQESVAAGNGLADDGQCNRSGKGEAERQFSSPKLCKKKQLGKDEIMNFSVSGDVGDSIPHS
ncbi:zinc finger CCCH domain-containing protein 27 isoform X1 [Amborella trichopoda]|uniref:zinc finger CCCH domain-containing protein 27 isoform X1 n=2 Tax=Amborella trichopoda TaxID=13333 RepID=UPI0005D4115E|nr:zinc finger CCCH domain-containing protein 27 isoform X1 [Amborella trichopoda]XP_011623449.1 zinc finger CCCH domain-containing protein 27 isoform X1 [Amborella trichopoda]XP_011623454.1 zinc finger CCCH domain-containing protein 27 isoform X1 [Amborella trichopoda]XP_020523640.1 zinc finger CCCH domain-containing protein 27 isoform X1 [Amborella trichopoda]|eukprot:XP_011623446.1 zinc finger CCCH domain-containing protein 27 isoform X1 [Amborella trichopoda]